MRSLFLSLISLIFVLSCSSIAVTPNGPQPELNKLLSPAQAVACHKQGGEIKQVCMMGQQMCVLPYADAGKECSGSKDCLGTCRNVGDALEIGIKAKGQCSVNSNPCGCFQQVENGRAEPAICID